MNAVFLTSKIDLYCKDEEGNKIPKQFTNINQLLYNFKKYIKRYENFLYVASVEDMPEVTDIYSKTTIDSFKLTLPFKNYYVLDGRNKEKTKELIETADFILLSGGHVPSQNKFFNNIGLREIIKNTNAVICGISAGSMSCADMIYCPPELEGESLDPKFEKYLKGLALTDINIMPHYNTLQSDVLDDKNVIKEIILPDSFKTKMLALDDGSYILIDGNITHIFGSAYSIINGKIEQINENEQILEL